jgi:hypothetical protein
MRMSQANGHRASSDVPGSMGEEILTALQLLTNAWRYARDVKADVWEFAVEIGNLHQKGVNNALLRWLEAQRVVDHREEITNLGENHRQFTPGGGRFTDQTCFVITDSGPSVFPRFEG